ncbi:MAG: 30S ribosomal protein S20 [Deltaproteobacteria bacterium RBG_16_42_7]|nr:MAG: 30S ribosomal protein S20 [Deltaproteobacteria bacterium RBG_16_42_7]
MRKNKSAIKKTRQSEGKRLRNSHVKSTMKTRIKKVVNLVGSKETEDINSLFKNAISYIDKASSKGVIHRNNAARKVSRLTKKVNSLLQPKG